MLILVVFFRNMITLEFSFSCKEAVLLDRYELNLN
jgi:hypothetical protein